MLCVTESWLTSDIEDNVITIPGYNVCRQDCENLDREHGGIVNYIKEGINYSEKSDVLNTCNRH